MQNKRKDWETKQEINTGNYLMEQKKQKENMEEIHVKICLKKINKGNKIPISLHEVKMEQKAWILVKILLIKMPSIKMKEQLVLIK